MRYVYALGALMLSAAFSAANLEATILGQATTPSGGVFTNACAGYQAFGGVGWAGDAFNGGATTTYVNCNNSTSVPGGSASASANNAGSPFGYAFTNSSSASASPGLLHLSGHNNASAQTDFAGAVANVGFNDTTTIGGGSGTGVLVLPFWVDGNLFVNGTGGGSQLSITAYKNLTQIDAYGVNTAAYNLFNSMNQTHNGDIYSSWDREAIAWGASGGGTQSLPVAEFVYFAIPITFGVQFEYGIYADVWLTQSSGAFAGQYDENALFSNTIGYAGGAYVMQGTNKITNITFGGSDAGIDYSQSLIATPEPSTIGLALLGVATFALRKRRAGL